MSQIFKAGMSGPIPPSVPTQFTADDFSFAVPAGNNLNVFSANTTDNNSNGIQSRATGDTVTYQLTNRIRVTATTDDGGGQTQTVPIFTPIIGTGITFVVSVTGYDSNNNAVAGGELVGIARRSVGGVTVVVGTNDTFDESDASLATADWDIITDGTLIQIQFIGVAGLGMDWSAVFIYDQAP